jgi:hypothetical protein
MMTMVSTGHWGNTVQLLIWWQRLGALHEATDTLKGDVLCTIPPWWHGCKNHSQVTHILVHQQLYSN